MSNYALCTNEVSSLCFLPRGYCVELDASIFMEMVQLKVKNGALSITVTTTRK